MMRKVWSTEWKPIAFYLGLFLLALGITYTISSSRNHDRQASGNTSGVEPSSQLLQFSDRLISGGGGTISSYEQELQLLERYDSDPDAVWRFVLRDLDSQHYYFSTIYEITKKNPLLAVEKLKNVQSQRLRDFLWLTVGLAFSQNLEEGKQILDKVHHHPFLNGWNAPDQFLKEPEQYADLVARLPPGSFRTGLLEDLAENWHRKYPKAALEWASTLPADCQYDAFKGLFNTIAENGLDEETLAFFDQEIKGQLRVDVATKVTAQIMQSSQEEALDWIDKYMSGYGKSAVVSELISALVKEDPALASDFVENLGTGRIRERAGVRLLNDWKRLDIDTAAEWILKLPPEDYPERGEWLNTIVASWYSHKPDAVIEFIEAGENVPPKFVEVVAESYWKQDPDSAMKWIGTLQDSHQAAATQVVEGLEAGDPAVNDPFR